MSTIGRLSFNTLWVCPLLALTVGCASLPLPDLPTEDIAKQRRQRADDATGQFNGKRDFAQFQDAANRWTQGDPNGCEEELERLLARTPDHPDARLLLADLCMADGRHQEAFEHVQQVLDANPENARASYLRGLLLDTTGQPAAALADYEKATQLEPKSELYAISYQTARDAAELPGGVDAAGFADVSDHGGVGAILHEEDASPDEGPVEEASLDADMARFREAAAANPDDPQIPISSAATALRHNRPRLALDILTQARQRLPDSAASCRILGVAHYRLGDYQSSQVALQQALSLDKSAALSYFLMGCTLAKLDQFESADAHFRQARIIDPSYSASR